MSKVKASSDLKQNTPISGTVVNSNDYILTHKAAYLQYIRDAIKHIIAEDELQYCEPMDKKKIYPAFNYIQFHYLLGRVHDEVYCKNLELLCKPQIYNNYNKPVYDPEKVKLCYEIYCSLCSYYGFICSVEGFYIITGISENTFKEWLISGYCDIIKKAYENSRNATVSSFENSTVPLLKLAGANYKYKLQTPLEEREQQAAVDVLPDLLAIEQDKKQLTSGSDSV